MKKISFTKKIICAAASCILFVSSLCAVTWSGVIDDNTKLSTSDFSAFNLYQSNGVYFSINSKLGESGLRLSSECSYKYKANIPFSSIESSTFTNIVDLSLLKLSGTWALSGGAISMNLGRFSYSDLSGVIFTQNSDGVYVSYDSMKMSAGFYAGYTGLQNSLNVSMIDVYNYDYDFYNLCAGYIPILADFAYKSFLKTNTIAFQLSGFLEPKKDFSSKYYATVTLSGPVNTLGNYSVKLVAGTQDFKDFMAYANANMSFFLNQKGIIGCGIEYASGNHAGFSPFTSITYQTAYSPAVSSVKSSVLLPNLSETFVLNDMVLGIYQKFAMPFNEKININGLEIGVNWIYNVLSDVQISCNALFYFDFADTKMNNNEITLKTLLSF